MDARWADGKARGESTRSFRTTRVHRGDQRGWLSPAGDLQRRSLVSRHGSETRCHLACDLDGSMGLAGGSGRWAHRRVPDRAWMVGLRLSPFRRRSLHGHHWPHALRRLGRRPHLPSRAGGVSDLLQRLVAARGLESADLRPRARSFSGCCAERQRFHVVRDRCPRSHVHSALRPRHGWREQLAHLHLLARARHEQCPWSSGRALVPAATDRRGARDGPNHDLSGR